MTIFFRLLDAEDKGTALQEAITALPQNPTPEAFAVNPKSFLAISKSPFAYWASQKAIHIFARYSASEDVYDTRCGMGTLDDFRFLRLFWEVETILQQENRILFAKGGKVSTYYSDIYLTVKWKENGRELKVFVESKVGSASRKIQATSYFFRPGLTYPLRSQKGISIRALPSGCIFSHKGPSIFEIDDNSSILLSLLAITNSLIFRSLVELQMAFGSYEVGVIQRTPVPDLTGEETAALATLAHRAWSLKRNLDTITQTSHAFILPALLQVRGATLSQRAQAWATTVAATEQELAQIQSEIDALAFELYGISSEEVGAGSGQGSVISGQEGELDTDHRPPATDEDEDDTTESADLPSLVHGLIEYALGVALGRFDLRLATGEREHPPKPEPFDPLPACSPGMLVVDNSGQRSVIGGQEGELDTDHQSLGTLLPPTSTEELPANYPIDIPFNGILVDDEGHPSDIVAKIRDVLDVIFPESDQRTVDSDQQTPLPTAHRPLPTASDIEQEACQILRVASLRDYIAKPSAFFAEHLSRYSKSRRQAPIYWPISTRSGSYTLWLYYHRLTDQTLYTCINDYVEPKLHQVNQATNQLRSQTSRTRDEDKRLETLQTLELELIDLRDELLRIAQLPYKPNLNDGVQITAAPLWPLFSLKKWQTKLKDTWKKLEKGDYDWAHLAYTIWPDRVREKCKGDKSLAIAHDLETLYEAPPEKTQSSRRKRK